MSSVRVWSSARWWFGSGSASTTFRRAGRFVRWVSASPLLACVVGLSTHLIERIRSSQSGISLIGRSNVIFVIEQRIFSRFNWTDFEDLNVTWMSFVQPWEKQKKYLTFREENNQSTSMKMTDTRRECALRMFGPFESNWIFGMMICNRKENLSRFVHMHFTEIDRIRKWNYKTKWFKN